MTVDINEIKDCVNYQIQLKGFPPLELGEIERTHVFKALGLTIKVTRRDLGFDTEHFWLTIQGEKDIDRIGLAGYYMVVKSSLSAFSEPISPIRQTEDVACLLLEDGSVRFVSGVFGKYRHGRFRGFNAYLRLEGP